MIKDFSGLVVLVVMVGSAYAADPVMRPGMWEITTQMDMPGMPMKMPAQTIRQCLTKQDIEQGDRAVPTSGDSTCQVKDYKVDGNVATWKILCSGAASMHGSGRMVMQRDSYTGEMESTMNHNGQTMEMTNKWTGKRVGDCAK
jgi:hypothetical protein